MCLINKNLNKAHLAPLADRESTKQLHFLILNCPYVVLINNYKASSANLDTLRNQVKLHNGFAYQPNKNIKTRAFKRLSKVLPLDAMNGLVVFIFFKDRTDMRGFLNILKSESYQMLTYYSMFVSGHLVNSSTLLLDRLQFSNNFDSISLPVYNLNRGCVQLLNCVLYYSLNRVVFILYAYFKSTSKGS